MTIDYALESHFSGRRRRMVYRASLGPIAARGVTKTEAREMLMVQLEAAVAGDREPSLIVYQGWYALVYRQLDQWAYRIEKLSGIEIPMEATPDPRPHDSTYIGSWYKDRSDAIRSARMGLAQSIYPISGLAAIADLRDPSLMLSYLHWVGFQRAYAYAMSMTGFTEAAMHRWAGDHADEERWLRGDEIEAHNAAVLKTVAVAETPL